jgi:hypothetical protein
LNEHESPQKNAKKHKIGTNSLDLPLRPPYQPKVARNKLPYVVDRALFLLIIGALELLWMLEDGI